MRELSTELQMEKFRGMTYCSTWNFEETLKLRTALPRCIALKFSFRRMFATEPNTMKCHRALEDVWQELHDTRWEISLGTPLEAMVASKYTPFIHREGGGVDDRSTTLKKIHDLRPALDITRTLVEVSKTNKGKWGSLSTQVTTLGFTSASTTTIMPFFLLSRFFAVYVPWLYVLFATSRR